jgi:leucyl/phenylalanyl-tRNA--protein transferase
LRFPDPSAADAAGLVAVGGDLSVPNLELAYSSGIFPWTDRPVTWWSPDPRAIIELGGLHVSRSLARLMRRHPFRITHDAAFPSVIQACGRSAPGRRSTWITRAFVEAYVALHQAGLAHSVECWRDDDLVGGVYGVAIGGYFAGESMFHRADSASKVALVELVHHLQQRGYALFDVQMTTPVTQSMGATEIPRLEFLSRLSAAIRLPCSFHDGTAGATSPVQQAL